MISKTLLITELIILIKSLTMAAGKRNM